MPRPADANAVFRPDLAATLEEFDLEADRMGFIGHRLLPPFEAGEQASTFPRIKLEDLLRNEETARSSRSGYNRGDWTFTNENYATEEHGWEEAVDDREAKIYAKFFDAESVSAKRARDIVVRAAERRAAALLFNAATFADDLATAVTVPWIDANIATATPILIVKAAKQAIFNRTGFWPNAIAFNRNVFETLRLTDEIRETIASFGAGSAIKATDITAQMLAQCFALDHVFVAGSAQNTAAEGLSREISHIWGDNYALVARVATNNDLREPCLGRTFHWGEDGSQMGGTVESYYEDRTRAEIVRCRHDVDEKLIYVEAGQLLTNVSGLS